MATFYKWDDTGSPGRNLSGNLQNRLRQILRTCLVDGYGSKAGAGWSVVHEHANGFSLRNGPQSGVVNFASELSGLSPYVVHLYLAEAVTDTSGAIVGGANVRSGTYAVGSTDPGTRHSLRIIDPLNYYLSTLVWSVVADEKSFVLSLACSEPATNDFFCLTLYVGEYASDLGLSGTATFIALGGGIAATSGAGDAQVLNSGSTALRVQETGLVGTDSPQGWPYAGNRNGRTTYPTGRAPANLSLQPVRVFSGTSFCGRLRGAVFDPDLELMDYRVSLRALGLTESRAAAGQQVTVSGVPLSVAPGYRGNCFLTPYAGFWP